MNKERQIAEKVTQLREQGNIFFIPENRKVIVHSFQLKEENIILKTNYGYGLNVESSLTTIPISDFDNYIKHNFRTVKTEPQTTTSTPTIKYSLKMSDTTENNISGLRKHLFEAIRKLEGGTMKADEAKAMATLAQTIINSAKLELEYKILIEEEPDIKMLKS